MNVIDLMDSKNASFSKTERNIYEGIKKFPEQFANSSITEISNHSGFTKASLTRFAKRLGFSGYVEFQFQFQTDLAHLTEEPQRNLSDIYSFVLKQTEQSVDPSTLEYLKKLLKHARNVYLTGTNLCRLAAEELEIALKLVSEINVIHPSLDILPIHYKKDDIFILYSVLNGKYHAELVRSLKKEDISRPHMILITPNPKHSLRHNFDDVIVLPSSKLSDKDSSAISDTFSFLMFNELLVQEIKNANKDTNENNQ